MPTINVLLAPHHINKYDIAKKMAKNTNLVLVSTEPIIKGYLSSTLHYYDEAQHWLNKGVLIPNWIIYHEVMDDVLKWGVKNDKLLVGFPRTYEQAEILMKTITQSDDYRLGEVIVIHKEVTELTDKDEIYYEGLEGVLKFFNQVHDIVHEIHYEDIKKDDYYLPVNTYA